jgi:hypothetical protein
MSGNYLRETAPPDRIAQAPPVIALDSHVHLYPGADWGMALSAGLDNLADAAGTAGHPSAILCLLLTETTRDDAFDALAGARFVPVGWKVRTVPGDSAALRINRSADDAELLLMAGRQIVTEERVEVLALATAARFSDGRPIREMLMELRSRAIPAVLPWGLGKWAGTRGATIAALLADASDEGLMLGDNAGRPLGWATPPLFRRATAKGIPVLPGSDPLPLPGTESGIGRFGGLIEGGLDQAQPAEDLRARLFALRGQPTMIGRRRGPCVVAAEQVALRRRKGAAHPAARQ